LNLGIDFKGGTQVTFTTPEPVSIANVRKKGSQFGKELVVQGRGKGSGGDRLKSFQIRTRSLTSAETSQLKNNMQTDFHSASIQIQTVSASFGKQIARGAIIAILFSLLLIIPYIALSFASPF